MEGRLTYTFTRSLSNKAPILFTNVRITQRYKSIPETHLLGWRKTTRQILGTLRYHDGDDNENVKKAIG